MRQSATDINEAVSLSGPKYAKLFPLWTGHILARRVVLHRGSRLKYAQRVSTHSA